MESQLLALSATQGWTLFSLGVTVIVSWLLYLQNSKRPYTGIPVLSRDRNEYLQSGRELLERGGRQYPSCFQVQTGTNWKIVVPNRFAQELKNHPDLSFNDAHARDSFTSYPGLEPFREILTNDTFIQEVVRKKLTQSLGLITAGEYRSPLDQQKDPLNVLLTVMIPFRSRRGNPAHLPRSFWREERVADSYCQTRCPRHHCTYAVVIYTSSVRKLLTLFCRTLFPSVPRA